jgi:prevent-host-death family protein
MRMSRQGSFAGPGTLEVLAQCLSDYYHVTMVTKKPSEGPAAAAMPAAEFKAKCLRVMDQVALRRRPVVVTKRGKPIVRIVPVDEDPEPLFGCLAGRFQIIGDIESPVLPVWDVLE